MEDEGKMDELIEQMKLMNVLLSEHNKREETKENFYTNYSIYQNYKTGWLLGLWVVYGISCLVGDERLSKKNYFYLVLGFTLLLFALFDYLTKESVKREEIKYLTFNNKELHD
jgi:hypothetical protein